MFGEKYPRMNAMAEQAPEAFAPFKVPFELNFVPEMATDEMVIDREKRQIRSGGRAYHDLKMEILDYGMSTLPRLEDTP